MTKEYLKLFKDGFDDTISSRRAYENYPFVGHDVVSGLVVYTVIPTPVEGPADNEIWYTSSNGNIVDPNYTDVFGANIVSNTYEDGKGVITFDGDVTYIGDYAFQYCSGLTSITIPDSVTWIGNGVFEYCFYLTTLVYNAHCFAYMPTSFEGVYVIPEGIKQIAGGAFADCRSIASVTIPESVAWIGNSAFYYCSSLTSITIPNSVTEIGDNAFQYCSGLTSITIPNSVTSIGTQAFYGCRGLTSIVVEEGNTIYDSRENCNAIIETNSNTLILGCQNTVIPNNIKHIESFAFEGVEFTSITIPESVTSIGSEAFSYCKILTSITYEGTQTQWNNIYKYNRWNYNVPATVVHCSDGDVAL